MPNGILIFLSVLAFSLNSIMTRTFQVKLQVSRHSLCFYQACFTLVAAMAYLIFALAQSVAFSASILLPAALFGICFAFASLFSAKCMEMGYMSQSSVIINLSLILPVIFSWVVVGEEVTAKAIIGLGLILVTLILSSISTSESGGGQLKLWLALVMIAFFANGSSAIIQKQYKASYGEEDLMLFMSLAYLAASIIFIVTFLVQNRAEKLPLSEQIKPISLLPLIAIVSGLGSFAGNGLLGYLCDKVNGGILYPCLNGGLCIAVSIMSFAVFKEKLTNKKLASIATGIAAIVLLNL